MAELWITANALRGKYGHVSVRSLLMDKDVLLVLMPVSAIIECTL